MRWRGPAGPGTRAGRGPGRPRGCGSRRAPPRRRGAARVPGTGRRRRSRRAHPMPRRNRPCGAGRRGVPGWWPARGRRPAGSRTRRPIRGGELLDGVLGERRERLGRAGPEDEAGRVRGRAAGGGQRALFEDGDVVPAAGGQFVGERAADDAGADDDHAGEGRLPGALTGPPPSAVPRRGASWRTPPPPGPARLSPRRRPPGPAARTGTGR